MSERIKSALRAAYGRKLEQHGDSPLATFQNDRTTQELRFERLLRSFLPAPAPFTLHDVGCGLCDLHGYLERLGVPHEYSGSELVPEMAELARQKHPDVAVLERDITERAAGERYDVVVLSGAFNLPAGVEQAEWNAHSLATVERMFAMARWGAAFNFLTTYNTFSAPELHYMDPLALFDFCQRRLSRFVVLDHGSPLYEGTLTVLREEFVKGRHAQPELRKYFRAAAAD